MSDNRKETVDTWSALSEAWQLELPGQSHGGIGVSELARQIGALDQRRRRCWIAVMVSELLITVIFGSWAISRLLGGALEMRIAGAFVLTLLVCCALFRFANRPPRIHVEGPRHQVALLIESNQRSFQALRFGLWLLAVQVVFFLAWLPWITDNDLGSHYLFLVLWSIGAGALIAACWRYLQREKRQVEALQEDLAWVSESEKEG